MGNSGRREDVWVYDRWSYLFRIGEGEKNLAHYSPCI